MNDSAFAYKFNGIKQSNISAVRWKEEFVFDNLFTAFITAKNDWDIIHKIGFLQSNTPYDVIARDLSGTQIPYRGLVLTSPTAPEEYWLNNYYLGSKTANAQRGTAGHEWGHVFGLDHVTGSYLMNDARDLDTIYVPKSDDINGAKALYP